VSVWKSMITPKITSKLECVVVMKPPFTGDGRLHLVTSVDTSHKRVPVDLDGNDAASDSAQTPTMRPDSCEVSFVHRVLVVHPGRHAEQPRTPVSGRACWPHRTNAAIPKASAGLQLGPSLLHLDAARARDARLTTRDAWVFRMR
jgi:hypothetical protein